MNIQWDKLLVESHVILGLFHKTLGRPVFYLFANLREAQRYAEKAKHDKEIKADSIQIKPVKDLFQF